MCFHVFSHLQVHLLRICALTTTMFYFYRCSSRLQGWRKRQGADVALHRITVIWSQGTESDKTSLNITSYRIEGPRFGVELPRNQPVVLCFYNFAMIRTCTYPYFSIKPLHSINLSTTQFNLFAKCFTRKSISHTLRIFSPGNCKLNLRVTWWRTKARLRAGVPKLGTCTPSGTFANLKGYI